MQLRKKYFMRLVIQYWMRLRIGTSFFILREIKRGKKLWPQYGQIFIFWDSEWFWKTYNFNGHYLKFLFLDGTFNIFSYFCKCKYNSEHDRCHFEKNWMEKIIIVPQDTFEFGEIHFLKKTSVVQTASLWGSLHFDTWFLTNTTLQKNSRSDYFWKIGVEQSKSQKIVNSS